MFGAAQIIAILILAQRGLEEVYSQYNTRRLLAEGAREVGAAFYPVVATTHLCWIAGLFLLVSPNASISWPLLTLFGLVQIIRYWVIGSLGRYWTHSIITLESEPVVRRGPYKYIRHPNYVITLIETMLLPLVFGAWGLALIMTAIWAAVLHYKIMLEDDALAKRREATKKSSVS